MGTSLKLINNMKHLFVSYEIALMAKEKGFNESCITRWGETSKKLYEAWKPMKNSEDGEDFTSAPLYQQLIDWFKDEHKILIRSEINGYDYEIIMITNFNTLHRGFDNIDLALRQAFELI